MGVRIPLVATALVAVLLGGGPARSATAPPPLRWTDVTPDAIVADATDRALSPAATESTALAALAIVDSLADRATPGTASEALERIAAATTLGADLRADAALLARGLASDEGTEAGRAADRALGVAEQTWVLGPFRDTGGGLDAHDGPESPGEDFDPAARHAWGSYEVAWRHVPEAFAGAQGIPLDLFVAPRAESCTWVAAPLVARRSTKLLVRAAASGQVRLTFDGVDVARGEAVEESAAFDRLAARIDAAAGPHLLAAKVCTGAIDDDGRVRLRVADDSGRWPEDVDQPNDRWAKLVAPRAAVTFQTLTTPLDRSLASPRAEGDARLEAAVVRTLGGADDSRSPRAPGLLAALADGLDDDRLALAAWITPDNASRASWLARARRHADPRTRAFVERRLVERHLEAQLADWAEVTLRGAGLDQAGDAEATALAARVETALGTEALRLRALRRLEGLFHAAPGRTPEDAVERLAQLAAPLDPVVALAAREELAKRGRASAEGVRLLADTKGGPEAARAAWRAFSEGRVEDADEALAMAQAVAAAGAHGDALRLYARLAEWAPNRAGVWAGLAHETDAAAPTGDKAVETALRRARELDPGESRYRAELALRTRSATLDPEARDDEKYLVPSSVILARRQGPGGEPPPPSLADPLSGAAPSAKAPPVEPPLGGGAPEVADRQLHWMRAVVMHPDHRVSELVQYAREIVIPPRTEDELYEDIPAEGDTTEILRARVHRKDGGTAFPVEEAQEQGKPRVRWPDLAPGDVVEVAFRSWTAGPVGGRGDPPFYRLDYAGALSTHPVVYNEVVVESPPDRPIYVDVVNGRPDSREERDEGGRHVVRLIWQKPVNVPDEPLAPQLSEVIPTVVLSTFPNWSAFRAWYAEAVRGFTEPDAEVRALAARLTRGKTSAADRLRAIFDFVADDIRYVNYVSAERWLPNRPQQLLARREGDCDDKALLLITLLKAVGIDAQEVMVQTRMTAQPSIVRAPGAAIPLFDHGIAFLPGPGGGTYLDATSPQSRLGPLPSMDARAVALRMEGPATITDLPASSPDDHGITASWIIRLNAAGDASVEGEERATGDDAFWMRTYLTEPGARAQWVEDRLIGSFFPTVQVDQAVDFQGDLTRGAAVARWRAHSDGLARHEGAELVLSISPSQTMASQLAPLVERTLPVVLPSAVAPRRDTREIHVVPPKGWSFEGLPPGGEEDGGRFGRARLSFARDPAAPEAVVVRRTLVVDQSTIPVGEYARWRAWIQRVDALMHKALRLVPAGGKR